MRHVLFDVKLGGPERCKRLAAIFSLVISTSPTYGPVANPLGANGVVPHYIPQVGQSYPQHPAYGSSMCTETLRRQPMRKKRFRRQRREMLAQLALFTNAYSGGFAELQQAVGLTYQSQICAASFAWAHQCISERAETLCLSPEQVESCWQDVINVTSRHLSSRDLSAAQANLANTPYHLPHGIAPFWQTLMGYMHGQKAVTQSAPEKKEKSVKHISSIVSEITDLARLASVNTLNRESLLCLNSGGDNSSAAGTSMKKIESFVKKFKERLPSFTRPLTLKQKHFTNLLEGQMKMARGSYSVCGALVAGTTELMRQCEARVKVDDSVGISLVTSVDVAAMRWYLLCLSHFQAEFVGSLKKENTAFASTMSISHFIQGGLSLPGWTGGPAKYYIWPALVYHARRILDFYRGRVRPDSKFTSIKLDDGIHLDQIFDTLDLRHCTEYELATVMAAKPATRVIAYYDSPSGGQVLKLADARMPKNEHGAPPNLSDRLVTAVPEGKLPLDFVHFSE